MSRHHSHLLSAATILGLYNGSEPFAAFLRKYFAQHKKFGSRDRKQVGQLCYCYFRLGRAALQLSIEERLVIGLFLCSDTSNEILEAFKPEWNNAVENSLEEKFSMVSPSISMQDVFPWKDQLSEGIDHDSFCRSFFVQPDLFLRLRPGQEEQVKRKLEGAGVSFKIIRDQCLALPNASRLDEVLVLDKEAVVQDYNSQRVGELLLSVLTGDPADRNKSVWDCCAASGGKSLAAFDMDHSIRLTVSDLRPSIIANLRKRFQNAGLRKYEALVVDLIQPSTLPFPREYFDIIICDAPCTGSGTWSRTPEQLFYFDENRIANYALMQQAIVSRVIPYLKPGGSLLYATCSVFGQENELIVDHMVRHHQLRVNRMELLKGYDMRADTMFVTLLSRES